ncbi:hypothetical protein FTUN_6781 [Frigoriglobus tundricola]|uniref:Uncharacterized protein n=1 Tax=Frigoriglobus tundricola TaxID=2774151 RepID=A0A6M5Z182_9BACT|nr:hypothetical protein FTUN_6781 [Frigoriglobus tundricola]
MQHLNPYRTAAMGYYRPIGRRVPFNFALGLAAVLVVLIAALVSR